MTKIQIVVTQKAICKSRSDLRRQPYTLNLSSKEIQTKQNKTKQSKAKQSKAKQEHALFRQSSESCTSRFGIQCLYRCATTASSGDASDNSGCLFTNVSSIGIVVDVEFTLSTRAASFIVKHNPLFRCSSSSSTRSKDRKFGNDWSFHCGYQLRWKGQNNGSRWVRRHYEWIQFPCRRFWLLLVRRHNWYTGSYLFLSQKVVHQAKQFCPYLHQWAS